MKCQREEVKNLKCVHMYNALLTPKTTAIGGRGDVTSFFRLCASSSRTHPSNVPMAFRRGRSAHETPWLSGFGVLPIGMHGGLELPKSSEGHVPDIPSRTRLK